MWLKEEGFVDLIKGWWDSIQVQGSASFRWAKKIKALKEHLKEWNKLTFRELDGKKTTLSNTIKELDAKEELGGLGEEERGRRVLLKKEYAKVVEMEEISWKQKSREIWLKEGDGNTKFFHKMANSHMRFNHIDKLKVEGNVLEQDDDIKEAIVSFYKKLYSEESRWRPVVDGIPFHSLEVGEVTSLEEPFQIEEVWEVVRELDGDKAPGPDGFTMAFFHSCWSVVKGDVMEVLHEFHQTGHFENSLNATFVTLIRKKGGADELKDFRPISLIGSLYKIIAKVLASRLKKVMRSLVSENQNAFIEGRQILDASLIANECVDFMLKKRIQGLVCKLDIEKAYDHVNWGFLLYLLRRMGFGCKWIKWISSCISSVSFSILVNGEPTGFFKSSRGLRQRDPLSPFLFILVMEVLTKFINIAMEGGLLGGCDIRGDGGNGVVSHLLFADDTLLFCKDSREELQTLRGIFHCFEAVSGLKVNLHKSEIIPIGEVEEVEELAAVLGCGVGHLPSTYLGLPLGAKYKSLAIWDPIVERFEKRLAGWKTKYLSKGGRLTLLKSTLSNLPIYFMSLVVMPCSIAHRLESIMRRFLWSGGEDFVKYPLVRWNIVTLPKERGGLGD